MSWDSKTVPLTKNMPFQLPSISPGVYPRPTPSNILAYPNNIPMSLMTGADSDGGGIMTPDETVTALRRLPESSEDGGVV